MFFSVAVTGDFGRGCGGSWVGGPICALLASVDVMTASPSPSMRGVAVRAANGVEGIKVPGDDGDGDGSLGGGSARDGILCGAAVGYPVGIGTATGG